MKAWRQEANQASARLAYFNRLAADPTVGIEKAYEKAYGGRGGAIAKAQHVRALPVPSVPMQQLLLRAGLWRSVDPVAAAINAPLTPAPKRSLVGRITEAVRRVFS